MKDSVATCDGKDLVKLQSWIPINNDEEEKEEEENDDDEKSPQEPKSINFEGEKGRWAKMIEQVFIKSLSMWMSLKYLFSWSLLHKLISKT